MAQQELHHDQRKALESHLRFGSGEYNQKSEAQRKVDLRRILGYPKNRNLAPMDQITAEQRDVLYPRKNRLRRVAQGVFGSVMAVAWSVAATDVLDHKGPLVQVVGCGALSAFGAAIAISSTLRRPKLARPDGHQKTASQRESGPSPM